MTCSVCGCGCKKVIITLTISDIHHQIERGYCQKCYDLLYENPKECWINRSERTHHATEKTNDPDLQHM